jgi:hypothetical protein
MRRLDDIEGESERVARATAGRDEVLVHRCDRRAGGRARQWNAGRRGNDRVLHEREGDGQHRVQRNERHRSIVLGRVPPMLADPAGLSTCARNAAPPRQARSPFVTTATVFDMRSHVD